MIRQNAMQGIIDLHDKTSRIYILSSESIIEYPLNDYSYKVTKTELMIQPAEGFLYESVSLNDIFTTFTQAQLELFDRRWRYDAKEV